MKRRAWIFGGALAAGTAASGLLMFSSRVRRSDSGKRLVSRSGPFSLPAGFAAQVLNRSGEALSDGSRSADLPDGMACFEAPDGDWILLRNHEVTGGPERGAFPGGQPKLAFSKAAHGGVSRLVLDPKSLRVKSSNMVLTGTSRNCAGGASPWGFLSCEESTAPGHGYAFLCRKDADRLSAPQPIFGYGRFRHEAAAFDPLSYECFLTEDERDGCFYRFTPKRKNEPFEGKLEALRVLGKPNFHTGTGLHAGDEVGIDWVPVDDANAKATPCRHQARIHGAAQFVRGEGAWLDGDGVVFTATEGGQRGVGQIFRLNLKANTLRVVAEADGQDLRSPDNITVAPWGDFLVAEDSLYGDQHVVGVTAGGGIYPVLRNELSSSELAGVCFSPDGTTLFCNIQADGLTVAIRGPWDTLSRAT